MRVKRLHGWKLSVPAAMKLQERLSARVREKPLGSRPRLVAGVDCGYSRERNRLYAAVVLCRVPERAARRPEAVATVEERLVTAAPRMPYVPGLLSFRELPAVLECFAGLSRRPEAVLVDGHGRAHPRRFGIACHLGIFLGVPTAGCAKSVLVGAHRPPGRRRGCRAALVHRGQTLGAALRTREGVSPMYASVGHLIDLAGAARLVLGSTAGFRQPEPTRRAHNLAARARAADERERPGRERSAGLVVFREPPGRAREYLIVRSRRHGAWGFPKGHVEAGESDPCAARREALEEAGLKDFRLERGWKQTVRYKLPDSGADKEVVYFLASVLPPAAGRPPPAAVDREIADWRWLPLEAARELLTFENTRAVLRSAAGFLRARRRRGPRPRPAP